jgi:DNA-binding SARP family transcriptional activator/Flp pilus assembly protein TadD
MIFRLKLFGGIALESATQPVATSAQQRRRLSLLAVLALSGERGATRDTIQAYLWPENSTERARHALEQLLYSTRRDLGPDSILSTATELRLNSSVVLPDVWLFAEAIRAERWRDAAELYAGPLLDGVHLIDGAEFEQLVDAERMQRQQDCFRALESLARGATAEGDAAESVRWWRRRVAADPVSLPAAIELMRALAAAGDRTGAIQQARTYQRVVRETLEVEPDPAVERLADEIASLANAPAPATARAVESIPSPSPSTDSQYVDHVASPAPRKRWRLRHTAVVMALAMMVPLVSFIRSGIRGTSATRHAGARATTLGTTDADAHALYLRGRTSWNKRTKDGLEDAVVQFRRAIDRDPTYAAAYTGLADSYAMLGYFGFAPADAMFPKAAAAARRALDLDPSAGEAYAALGQSLAWEHKWAEAERAYQRALTLSPNDPTVHQWYGLLLAYLGRAHEAAVHTGHAARLDPLSVQINNMYGMMLYYDGDLRGAFRQFERTVVAEPDSAWVRQNPWVLANFARVAAAAGRHQQAVALMERALEVVPTHPRALFDLAYVYVMAGDRDRARAVFTRADSTHAHYTVNRALLHAVLGELDDAFAWFNRIDEWALPPLVTLSNEPGLAALRADARFQRIRKRLAM